MLLILVGIHIFFGFIGYMSGSINFEDTYYSSRDIFDDGYLFVCTIFLSIFIFIGWLIFYMRSNALKNFYPKKTSQLYAEWLLILLIITGIALIPVSTTLGVITRSKTTVTLKEAKRALDIIEKARVLVPNGNNYYTYNSDNDVPIPIPKNKIIDLSGINLNLYDLEYDDNGKLNVKGYIGPSLLFYSQYHYNYYDDEYNERKKEKKSDIVKDWLRTEQRDKIYQIMVDFNELQQRHQLEITITPDQWLERVYNPPFYPIDNSNIISDNKYNYYSQYNRHYDYEKSSDSISVYVVTDYFGDTIMTGDDESTRKFVETNTNTIPYLQISELEAAYEHIANSHTNNEFLFDMLLIIFCISIGLSIFVFSYRVTGGKAWLIAFVSSGVIFFFIVFLGVLIADSSYSYKTGPMFVISFWLTMFAVLFVYLLYKVIGSKAKGFSSAPMNIFLWLIPCIIPMFCYNLLYLHQTLNEYHSFYMDEEKLIFWFNIFVVIIAMYPIAAFVRKWKGIAEE